MHFLPELKKNKKKTLMTKINPFKFLGSQHYNVQYKNVTMYIWRFAKDYI